ncbi:MAG TPA: hypothetical protein VIX86_16970 [Streptosporangiaceae bacterium]
MSDEADQADPAEPTGPARYVSAGPPTCVACGRFIPEPRADPPGFDEITVAAPEGRPLCSNRAHRDLGLFATVVVTFGQLGTLYLLHEALWPETWGCSYPFCGECWDTVRGLAERKRPGLVIRDATKLAGAPAGGC